MQKRQKKEKINPKQNKYVVKKYIMATSVQDAIRKDKKSPIDGCWIDEDWLKKKTENACDAIGFCTYENEDEKTIDKK